MNKNTLMLTDKVSLDSFCVQLERTPPHLQVLTSQCCFHVGLVTWRGEPRDPSVKCLQLGVSV